MDNLREIITENLLTLRRKNKMTQQDLAKQINYSDKAVSRWENGEVLPDVETLAKIAEVYGVPLSRILEKDADEAPKKRRDPALLTKALIAAISVCVVWAIAVVIYVYIRVFMKTSAWQVFIWAIPVSALLMQFFNTRWIRVPFLSMTCSSVAIWGLITAVYCTILSYNIWLIFLIGIPLQAIVVLVSILKKERHKLKTTK